MRTIVVDGVEIPEALLAQEVQNHPAASVAESRTAAGHALAIRALLLQRAFDLGLEPEPELDAEGREETAEEALVRAVLEREVEAAIPTEAECRRVYDADPSRFRAPPLYEASHILVEPRGEGAEALESARKAAARVIAALGEVPARFDALAREVSDCPSAATGGSLGQLRPGDLVGEVEAALGKLAPGETAAAPVRSRFGWHVLRLDRRVEGRQFPFELVHERIRLHLESRAWAAAAARYAAALTAEARSKGVALSLTESGAVAAGPVTLGELLDGDLASGRLEAWLAATDPALAGRIATAAEAAGEEASAFVHGAVAEFVGSADDAAWTKLVSAARDAEDPALAALAAILKTKLAPPARRAFTVIGRRKPS